MEKKIPIYTGRIKLFNLLLFASLLFGYSCNGIDDLEKQIFREIAWESLTEQARETVTHGVDEAKVNLNDTFLPFSEAIPAVSVRFNTIYDASAGPIIVYIDRETKEVLGQPIRF